MKNSMSISECSSFLKLPAIKNNYDEYITTAINEKLNHKEFLELVMQNEVENRIKNSYKNRIRRAKFRNMNYLCDFIKDGYSPDVNTKLTNLETMLFIEEKNNVILIGNPGVGKTHFATAIGIEACMKGKNVLYQSIPNLVLELNESFNKNQITRYKKNFNKYDLVILDELGYVSFDQKSSELLFNLISDRVGNGSIIITTNLTFDKWKDVFHDPILTGALVDRMIYNSKIINMTGDSHRLKTITG